MEDDSECLLRTGFSVFGVSGTNGAAATVIDGGSTAAVVGGSNGSSAGKTVASDCFSTTGDCAGGGGGSAKLATGGGSVGDANVELSADSGEYSTSDSIIFTSDSSVFFDVRIEKCFSASSPLDAAGSCSIGSGSGSGGLFG